MAKRKSRIEAATDRATLAKLNRETASDKLKAEQYKFYLNDNIKSTRKRRVGSSVPASAERDMSSSDRKKALQLSRQKVMESPLVMGIVQTLVDNIVGSGFMLNMKTKNADFNEEVESRWKLAKDRLDVRGVRSWFKLLRMWQYRKTIDGDVGLNLVDGGMGINNEKLSYVQTIEAERIHKTEISDIADTGIDFDKRGKPKKYYVGARDKTKSGNTKNPKGIAARDFILYANYPHERAERARGVSMLLQNLNLFADVEEIIDAMRLKVKNEAFMGIKFKMDAGPDGQIFPGTTSKTNEDGVKRKTVKLVPNLNLNMAENEDAEVLESKSPNAEFMPFARMLIRYAGSRFGLPLEMILFDFSETNYSGGRALLELSKRRFRVEQKELQIVASRVFTWWLSREIKHNKLEVPSDINGTHWAHRWGVPGWPYLDPMKSANANALNLANGTTSRSRILEDTGENDFDDLAEQISREQKLMEKLGIKYAIGMSGQEIVGLTEDTNTNED